jgi:hypothetical protein
LPVNGNGLLGARFDLFKFADIGNDRNRVSTKLFYLLG